MDTEVTHVIDCDAPPFLPERWKVEEHRQGSQFTWDPSRVKLYLSPNQLGKKSIQGHKLRKELANEPVLNANVLDFLLAHPHLIPEEWKKDGNGWTRHVFFWGTIYRDADGRLCVRSLFFAGGRWSWDYGWLGRGWFRHFPSALRAS